MLYGEGEQEGQRYNILYDEKNYTALMKIYCTAKVEMTEYFRDECSLFMLGVSSMIAKEI